MEIKDIFLHFLSEIVPDLKYIWYVVVLTLIAFVSCSERGLVR